MSEFLTSTNPADLGAGLQHGPGAQVCEGTDRRPLADPRLDRVRVQDPGSGVDLTVAEGRVRADLAALAHVRRAEQADARRDGAVRPDGHVRLYPGAGRA